MKTITELREINNRLNPKEIASSLRYLSNQKLDFDVYLPTRNKNLQRDFVWNLDQKRELILSVLYGRHITHLSIINKSDDTFEIIDGKQRLSTMIDFYNDKFTILLENKEYYYKDLPEDYKLAIKSLNIRYYIVNEEFEKPITDEDKISWFKFLNFAGTPQEKEYLDSL